MRFRLRTLLIVLALAGCQNQQLESLMTGQEPEPDRQMESRPLRDEQARRFIEDLGSDLYDRQQKFTANEALVYRLTWMLIEINNGGIHQFFYNSTGSEVPETLDGLHKIGANKTAMLIENACRYFPNGTPSRDYIERRQQLEAFTPLQISDMEALTTAFFEGHEDVYLLLKKYWEANSSEPQ